MVCPRSMCNYVAQKGFVTNTKPSDQPVCLEAGLGGGGRDRGLNLERRPCLLFPHVEKEEKKTSSVLLPELDDIRNIQQMWKFKLKKMGVAVLLMGEVAFLLPHGASNQEPSFSRLEPTGPCLVQKVPGARGQGIWEAWRRP